MPSIPAHQRHSIVEQWLDLTFHTYPEQSVQFMLRERDPFRNPLGQALRTGLPAVFDELLDGNDLGRMEQILESIVRIRAVQDFSASQAIGFVFLLKKALDREFPNGWREDPALEDRIDRLALLAFDLFMRCREKIYEVQADEGKRRLALLERMYSKNERR